MSRQLEDLLELSRIGRVVNPPENFSLTDVCHGVEFLLQGPIERVGARIEIAKAMPVVTGERIRIGEVIRNLLENAIRFYRREGVPEVRVDGASQGGKVDVVVCDNGPGIEPRYRDKVFELFDRLDDSVPGTGIGRALARRIVELHGGRIWVETAKNGQGSCFCFTLPAAAGEEP